MLQQVDSPTEWLVDRSKEASSRFISAAVLLGRRVAAADDVIETSERNALVEAFRERLHLDRNVDSFLTSLLDEAVEGNVSAPEDENHILSLVEGFREVELLNIFAFGCRIAGADGIFQPEEQSMLTDYATIFGVETRDRNILFAAYCGDEASGTFEPESVEDLMSRLDPSLMSEYGRGAHEFATDNVRGLQKYLSTLGDEGNTATARSSADSIVRNAGDELSSGIRRELEQSPLREQLEARLEEVLELPGEIIGRQGRSKLNRLLETTEDEQFRIAVIGNFSTGKSTLLNALCRPSSGEVFPTSTIPCTGTVSILRYGEEDRRLVRKSDGSEAPIPAEAFEENVRLPEEEDRASGLRNPNAEAVVVEHPLSLCEGGVELIDTPGLNENPRRTEITDEYLRRSDAVVYTMKADQLLSKQEKDFIEGELFERIDPRNLFFVVNYWDQVRGTEDAEKVRTRIESFARDVYPDELSSELDRRIHCLSAQCALEELREARNDSPFLDRLEDFEAAIGSYLADTKGDARWRRKADRLMRELPSIRDNAEARASQSLTQLDRKIEENKRDLEQIRRHQDQLRDEKEQALETVKSIEREVVADLKSKFQNFRTRVPERLRARSKEWTTEASPLWNKEQIEEDFQKQLKEDLQELIKQWAETQAQTILEQKLHELKDRLNRQFEDINEQMRQLQERTESDLQLPTHKAEEEEGAFVTFMKGAGGFVAGGPVGALVGTQLELEDMAINVAANFAAGFVLALAGLGGPLSLIVAAAGVGVTQLVMGQDKVIDNIRDNMVEAALENLPQIMDDAKQKIDDEMGDVFREIATSIEEALEAQIEDIESQIESQLELLKEAKEDKRQAERELKAWKKQVKRVEKIARDLEDISNVTFEAAQSSSQSQSAQSTSLSSGKTGGKDSGEQEPTNNRTFWAAAIVALLVLGLVLLVLGGTTGYFFVT